MPSVKSAPKKIHIIFLITRFITILDYKTRIDETSPCPLLCQGEVATIPSRLRKGENGKRGLARQFSNMNFPSHKTIIMGILNVTPDSFSDGGEFLGVEQAVGHALKMIEEGADIIDIGGESTRPGSEPVSEKEELRRVMPVIERLVQKTDIPISIDTHKPAVAEVALKARAKILNDVTGLTNPAMIGITAKFKCPVVIMHMQGAPKTMQANPHYNDVVDEIKTFFKKQIASARAVGLTELILDPGIGFGKTLEHNLTILKRLNEFTELGYPILVGPSRKSFIGKLTGDLPANKRLEGTIAAIVTARLNGASMVRVHDVLPCRRALQIADAILNV
jgi:dihydropteroate synthase